MNKSASLIRTMLSSKRTGWRSLSSLCTRRLRLLATHIDWKLKVFALWALSYLMFSGETRQGIPCISSEMLFLMKMGE